MKLGVAGGRKVVSTAVGPHGNLGTTFWPASELRTEDCPCAPVVRVDLSRGFKSFGSGIGSFEKGTAVHQHRKRSLRRSIE